MSHKRSPLFVLFFTIFLDMLGLGILIPVIPALLANPHSPHYLLAMDTPIATGYILLGILLAFFSFGQFIASPIIGQFSDKFGRKRLLAFSIFGTSIGHALFAVGILFANLPLLFFARLFAGITGGNIVVAQAAIADITTPENRTKNFGLIGAAFGLGFIVGPFLGGKLADASLVSWFGATTPFWFASILSLVNAVLILTFLRETNQNVKPDQHIEWGRSIKNIAHAFRLEQLRPLFITNFLFQSGFAFYTTFSAVYLYSRFGFTEGMIGNYFAFIGLWIVITQGLLTRFVSKKFKEQKVMQNSLVASGICIIAIVLAPNPILLYCIVPFFAAAIGLTQANITALISRSAGASVQGEVLGLNGSLNALSQTVPPLISGIVAAYFEPSAPLLIAAILAILSGLYFINHLRRGRE